MREFPRGFAQDGHLPEKGDRKMDMKMKPADSGAAPILTMAFVAFQPLDRLYEPEEGFDHGTIFPSLNKPFWREMDLR